jgi:membrane-bound serine protease (ClpP class)
LIGSTGNAETGISKSGKVFVIGELWNAYSDDKIEKGSKVEIVDVEGMTLKVKKQ